MMDHHSALVVALVRLWLGGVPAYKGLTVIEIAREKRVPRPPKVGKKMAQGR